MHKVEMVKLKDLVPDDRNARLHNERNIAEIARSLQELGQHRPFVVQKGTNRVIVGNGMLQAALSLGWAEGLALFVDDDNLTAIRRGLADNRTAELAEWDEGKLAELLAEVESYNTDVPGFSADEINELCSRALEDYEGKGEGTEGLTDPDEVPDVPEEPTVQLGEIWLLGDHRLMCGDSTDEAAVKRLMVGEKADMVFTDPPYGVSYDGGTTKRERLRGDDTTDLYSPACQLAFKYSKSNAALYLWHAGTKALAVNNAVFSSGWEVRSQIVWNKNLAQFGALSAQYKQKHEPCYYCFKIGQTVNWDGPTNEVSVWDADRAQTNEYHPTQKPVALAERAIRNHKAQSVLDLFGGSGSTLIACEKTGRRCYMMELDPKYCDVIIRRWENFTGGKATLEGQAGR